MSGRSTVSESAGSIAVSPCLGRRYRDLAGHTQLSGARPCWPFSEPGPLRWRKLPLEWADEGARRRSRGRSARKEMQVALSCVCRESVQILLRTGAFFLKPLLRKDDKRLGLYFSPSGGDRRAGQFDKILAKGLAARCCW